MILSKRENGGSDWATGVIVAIFFLGTAGMVIATCLLVTPYDSLELY